MPADYLLLLGAIILIALMAGFASGLLGIGGGIFLVPTFLMLFSGLGDDIPQLMQLCVCTSTACVMVTTSRVALSHYRRGALDTALLRAWGPSSPLVPLSGPSRRIACLIERCGYYSPGRASFFRCAYFWRFEVEAM
ncbi:TSUP family transporter [Roseibium algae]|uniref:Probable membrane transporter protein n=1 Tax=Roseibium algae TaxID=3123038 RepID=A0ABU8TS47_9HYPH